MSCSRADAYKRERSLRTSAKIRRTFSHTARVTARCVYTRQVYKRTRESGRRVALSSRSAEGGSIDRSAIFVRPDRTSRTSAQGQTTSECNAGRDKRHRIKAVKEKKTAKLDHPCFPTEPRILESSGTSVNPSWIVIERCQGAIDTLGSGEEDRDSDLYIYLGESHSFVARPRAVKPFDEL